MQVTHRILFASLLPKPGRLMWDSPWKIDFFVRAGRRKKEFFFKMILLRVLRGTALKFQVSGIALESEFRLPPPKAVAKSFCHCFEQLFAEMQLDFEQNFKKILP